MFRWRVRASVSMYTMRNQRTTLFRLLFFHFSSSALLRRYFFTYRYKFQVIVYRNILRVRLNIFNNLWRNVNNDNIENYTNENQFLSNLMKSTSLRMKWKQTNGTEMNMIHNWYSALTNAVILLSKWTMYCESPIIAIEIDRRKKIT